MRFRSFVLPPRVDNAGHRARKAACSAPSPTTSVIRAGTGHGVQHCPEVAVVSRVNAPRRALLAKSSASSVRGTWPRSEGQVRVRPEGCLRHVPVIAIDPHPRWEERDACVKP